MLLLLSWFSPFPPCTYHFPFPQAIPHPLFMSMGHVYKFLSYSISYAVIYIPMAIVTTYLYFLIFSPLFSLLLIDFIYLFVCLFVCLFSITIYPP